MRYTENRNKLPLLQILQQQQTKGRMLGRHADRIASKAQKNGA